MSLFYRRGKARPRPSPFDMVLDGLRVMLLQQDRAKTQLVSQKPPDQSNVVPTDYGEDARSPLFGKNTTWDSLHLGVGQRTEPRAKQGVPSGRYRWAVGADCSVAGRPGMPGPDITQFTPGTLDASNPVNRFFDLGGSLYWLNGRYLQRRDNDGASTAVQDLGASKVARDVAVFGPNSGSTTYAFVAMGDADNIWRYDGSTATQHASLKALAFTVRGTDLHRALSVNQVSTVDTNSDPWTAANWNAANQFYIGDKNSAITRLTTLGSGSSGPGGTDFLLVAKTDGIYSLNVAGEDQQFFPHMKFAPATDNGEVVGHFLNDLYIRMGETLYVVTPAMQADEIGPERYGALDALLQGKITAFAGHASFHAYAGLWNHATSNAYLLKFGAHVEGQDGAVARLPSWNGSISQAFSGKRITALFKSAVGAPANHARLYLGFSNGTIGWFTLPCVPDPAACDQYRWGTTEGSVRLSEMHFGFRGNEKLLLSATVGGESFSGNAFARVGYALNGAGSTTDLSANFDAAPRKTVDFPEDTVATVAGLTLYVRSLVNTAAPLVTSLSVRWRLQTPLQQVYSFIVAAQDNLLARDGTPLRYGAKRIRQVIRAAVNTARTVTVVLPDEEQKRMSLIDLQEQTGWDPTRGGRWRAGLQVTAVEESAIGIFGTYDRLSLLTYDALDAMLYEQLETI